MSLADLGPTIPPDPYSDTGAFEESNVARDRGRDSGRRPPPRRPPPPHRSRSRSPDGARSHSPNYRHRSPAPSRPGHAPSATNPSNVLGVFGLSIRTQERDLEDEFSRFGKVDRVTIVYDQRSDRSRGFGFIKMANLEDAARCIQELNGLDLHGRRIRVDYSVTERAHAPTPGQYMGHRKSTRDDRDRDRDYRSSRYERDRYDRDRYDRDRDRDRHDRDRDRDRDRERDRDRDRDRERMRERDRDRDRDRDGRYDRDRDRDGYGRDRDWRDRRSSPRRTPERRSRRSYSHTPPRGAPVGGQGPS